MDRRDFERRVLEAEHTLYRVAWSVLRNDADCQDAVQEAVLLAWEKLDGLRRPEYFRTWLVRILLRVCYRLRREAGRLVPFEDLPEPSAPAEGAVWREIQALPEPLRLPFVLHYVEGYIVAETGDILKLPAGTVKSRLSRARSALRMELEEWV